MNKVILTGRLTKDIELRFTNDQKAVTSFSLAVDRGTRKDDGSSEADFPRVNCFGKTAENLSNYCHKGSLVLVEGSIRTGSYQNKNGETVYTTDISAYRVEFLDNFGKQKEAPKEEPVAETPTANDVPDPWGGEIDNTQLPWNM